MYLRYQWRFAFVSFRAYPILIATPSNTRTTVETAPQLRWSSTTPAQRKTVIAAGLGWMLDAFDVMLYSIVLATLMREFGMTKSTAGLLNSFTLAASALGSVAFGFIADRSGRRQALSLSILTYSVSTFACGFATTIPALAALRFLLGLGMGGEWNAGATLVAETWPSAWRGRALSFVQGSWAIGYALAAAVGGLLLPYISWRGVFFVGVLPALLVFWIRRDVPEPELWRTHHTRLAAPNANRKLWAESMPSIIALLATNAFGLFAWWGLFTWIPAYLSLPASRGGRDFTELNFTLFLVILNLCGMLPGYLLFGSLADRWGRKRTFVLYLACAAICVPAFAAAHHPALILLTASASAFFGTGFFTGSAILGSELFPTPIRATALGVSYNTARGLSAFAPFIIGTIGEQHGLNWGFTMCGIAFACAAIAALFVPETRGVELV